MALLIPANSPAANDDTDLTNISVKVNVQADTSSGNAMLNVNLGTDTTLVVDSVADNPVAEDLSSIVTQQDNVGHGATGEAKDVAITVKATFGDVLDGSEKHSFELKGVPTGWALDQAQLPAGWIVSGQSDNGDGTYTLVIDVTNAAKAAGQADGTGTVGTTLHFNPGDWTSGGLTDSQGTEHGRHSDGTPNSSGPASITVTAVAEETASDGELPNDNNRSETELGTITVTLTEDAPTATVNGSLFTDEKPGEQGSEADWASVSPTAKGVIDHALDALEQKGISGLTVPMNLSIPGSSSSSVLGASTTTVSYNLYSDGRGDANQGGSTVGFSIDTSTLPQSAKLPGDAGYSDIHYEPVTDSAGNLCMVGYFTNTGGDKVVALVVTVEPNNLNGGAGTANVTIVQYTAFKHSDVQGSNTDTYTIKLTLADDDGDKVTFDVKYVTQDDTPQAFEDRGDLDEAVRDNNGQSMVGGNVLDNDQGTADGWQGGEKGVVGCKITLPADYSIDGDPAALSLGAPYTIMYKGVAQGTFILNADGNWQFTSGTGQDIIKDFDFTVTYTVRDADGDTEGNESAAGSGGSLTITDEMGGRISIANAPEVLEGQDLVFKLSVTGTTISSGLNFNEDVVVTLQLAGKDGTGLDAASLEDIDFARLQAANPNIVINSYNPATGEITITLSHGDWTHATSTSHNYDLHIPTRDDGLLAEAREGVQVSITDAKGAEIDFSKSTGTSATGTIKDEAGLRIAGDTVIYEDAVHGKTVATYHVEVLDKLVAVGDGSGKVAGQGFSFDITLQGGKATFDSNIKDNYVTAGDPTSDLLHNSNVGDYGWAIGDAIIQYGDLSTDAGKADLIKAINDFLASDSKYDGIRVTDVTNGGRSLTFEVAKGASIDALEDMPIQVAAIDDAKTETDESYTVRLGNIVEHGTTDGHESLGTNEAHVGSNNVKTSENTTIKDDGTAESRDGYYVGLKSATVAESSSGAIVPVAFFQHDANGNIIDADRNNPPSSEGFTLKLGTQNDGATQNEDFVVDNSTVPIPPYSADNSKWSYVEASGTTPAHWEYKVDLSTYIPIKDDRLTEGNEDFTLELKSVSGHESSKLPGTGVVGDVKNEVKVTIEDDKTLAEGPYKLDGPEISFFGPMDKVIEPIAPGQTSSDEVDPHKVTYKVGLSQTAAQDVVLFINIPNVGEDFTLEGTANFGALSPAKLGELKLAYPQYNLEPNGAGYFLIIPKGQSSGEITVQIKHDHDSSSVPGGKDDSSLGGNTEHVHMEITNMQGSEARYIPGDANNTTHTPIQDDMRGPVVSFEVSGNRLEWSGENEPHIKLSLPVNCDEDVTVRIELRDASGNLLQDASGNTLYLTHTFAGGAAGVVNLPIAALLADVIANNPGTSFTLGTDFFIKIAGVTGGEAQANTNLIYMDHDSGTSIELDNFKASDIHEGQGDTVVYTLDLEIPSGYTIPANGVSFDLKVLHNGTENEDFGQGTNTYPETITVTISKGQLDLLPKDAANNITIKQDGVYFEGQKIGEVSGSLPSAYDDKLVEGDEGFYTIITNPSGVDIDDAVADSKIIDNDKPIVKVEFVDANGNVLTNAPEGGEVYVRVSLVDALGNPVTLGGGSADFELKFTGGTNPGEATEGSDFYSSYGHVTIPGVSSESNPNGTWQSNLVKVVLPDDFISEGDEKFSVSANYVQEYSNYGDATIFGTVEGSELTITDHINGPVISFAGTTSTTEKGSANYTVTLDKSLEEKAELLFKLDLSDGDSKDGFVITEIDTIKVDGITYTVSEDGQSITWKDSGNPPNSGTYTISDSSQKVHLGTDGNLYVTMTMEDRSVRESFQVTLRNDYISENDEILKVTLVDTKGGELHLGGGLEVTAGNGPSVNTTVKDYLDGPTVSLNKLDASGTEGESVSVSLGLSKPTVSESTIELQLGDDVATKVVNGTTVTVSNGSGFSGTGTIDPATGKVTITLPAGTSGPLTVTFPLQDNVETGDNPQFSISLGGAGALVGGETTLAGSLSFGSSFAGETNNSMTFDMSGSGTTSADAQGSLTLGNIAGGANSVDHITLTYPGLPPTVVTVPASALTGSGSTLVYNWNAPAGTSLDGVKVDVVFKQSGAPGAMTPEQLADTKLNATVNGSLSGMSVTVDVKDDAGTSLQDGPVFSVVPHDPGYTAEEGATVTFTLDAVLKSGYTIITDPDGVSITFKLTGSYTANAVSVGEGTLQNLGGGEYKLTLPKDTNLQDWMADGKNTITVGLPGNTAQLAADKTVKLEITKVEQGEAELNTSSKGETITVEDTTEGLLVFSADTANVAEGSTANIIFKLVDAGNQPVTSTTAVTFEVKVSGNVGDISLPSGWVLQANGNYKVTLPAGQSSVSLGVNALNDTVLEGPEGVRFEIISVTSGNAQIADHLNVGTNNVHDLTVTDSTSGRFVLNASAPTCIEGETARFTLALVSAAGAALVAVQDTSVQLTFAMPSGHAIAGSSHVSWLDNGNNTYTATVTLPAGDSVVTIDVPTFSDHLIGSVGYPSVAVTDAQVTGSYPYTLEVVNADGESVTGGNPLQVHMVDAETHDFSHAESAVTFAVADGDTVGHHIIGSDHGDILSGGAGNDTLHGGAGNDFLHGGLGANELFGGEGNDILVFSADNILHDGGVGALDILVGGSGTTFDAMANSAAGIEVFLTTDKDPLDLTNLDAFKDLGIQVNNDDTVILDTELWTRVEDVHSGESTFVHYQSDDGDLYVLQHLVANQAG